MATYISDEKISETRQAADIVEIISETVILKKAGKNMTGLCPFHAEKTPSFTVSPDKQMYYCFGCGSGGNVFSFVMKRDGVAFAEAVRLLARRCGVEIPERPLSPAVRKQLGEKSSVLDANRKALSFFQRQLAANPAGLHAREYLQKRGIQPQTIEAFQIGFAPQGWDNLISSMLRQGISGPMLEKAGLAVPRKDGRGYYDRFRERIIFPILDDGAQVVAFGGRVMDDSTPKYLNSPETLVYSKRRTLYGLNRAKDKCRASGSVYIVEGYLDLIALHQGGIENSVATLGTALTGEHLRLLTRYAERMVLVYDSDDAGIRSAHRCVEVFWREHVDFRRGDVFRENQADTRILVLPGGHDPDSFIRQNGAAAFKHLADEAPGLVTFLMEAAVGRHGLSTEGKIRIVADLAGPLGAINDSVAQALYIKQLSERIGLPEAVIRKGLLRQAASAPAFSESAGSHRPPVQSTAEGASDAARFERRILTMMLQYPQVLPEVQSLNILEFFENSRLKSLAESLIRFNLKSSQQLPEFINFLEDEESRKLISALGVAEESWNEAGCRSLLDRFLYNRQKEAVSRRLQQKIEAAEKARDEEELTRLLLEKQRLTVRREKNRISALRRK